ncbi:hypothetical protein HOU24_gp57 [Corynebacterium phage SamW]|uniref:Uncharacterized protein n=2 Tax=Samwavirus samW TaxID=2734273 RepID=A0A385UJX2_9CAUD|nr:hypothetical protein HOU24_gp57 [Corynebacterium phage SamW]AYB70539.1 hypothetical protein SAMW_57 [Corynebacterium phage SamW]AYQ98834.1 hypothetical protein TROY_57 [Corynebacterium phage Troy]
MVLPSRMRQWWARDCSSGVTAMEQDCGRPQRCKVPSGSAAVTLRAVQSGWSVSVLTRRRHRTDAAVEARSSGRHQISRPAKPSCRLADSIDARCAGDPQQFVPLLVLAGGQADRFGKVGMFAAVHWSASIP